MIQCAEAPPSNLVAKGIRKGAVFFLGGEFTLSFDPAFLRGHRTEYEVFVDLVKRLRQKRFDDRRNVWNIPLADDSIKCLTQLVNWGITPTKEAREKLSIELKAVAEQKAAAQAVTEKAVEISIPTAPELEKALKNYQKIGVNFMVKAERAYNADDMGLGKAQPLSEPVLTHEGWVPMGGIRPGMMVIGRDGNPTEVLKVFPQGNQQIVKVKFNDGTRTRATWDHLWTVQHVRNDRPVRYQKTNGRWRVMTTAQIVESGIRDSSGNLTWRIPLVRPITFASYWKLPLHPYLVGVMLGDGGMSTNTACLTSDDPELVDTIKTMLPAGCVLKQVDRLHYYLSKSKKGPAANPITVHLRNLGMWGKTCWDKSIPHVYKHASIDDRLELVRGLMDTDGCAMPDGTNEYSSVCKQLSDDMEFVIQSLGGVCRRGEKKLPTGSTAFTVRIKMPPEMCPFRLSRKVARWKPSTKYPPSRIIASIEPDGFEEAQCIMVAARDSLYVTRNCIVTHNTLQALAAVEKAQAYPALIVCPVKLKQNWLIECRKWLPHRKASMRANDMAEITVLSYTEIHKYVNYRLAAAKADARKQAVADTRQYFYPSIMKVNAVICDEAHQVKTATAMRTQACKAVVDVCASRFRFLLSGTPIENAPHEMIAPLNFLGLMERMGGWHTFVHRYCGVTKKEVTIQRKKVIGGKEVLVKERRTAMDIRGASNTKELHARMSGLFYIRRRKGDVLAELPDKIESIQEAEIDNLEAYRRIESDVRAFMVESRGQLMTEGQLKAQAMMKLNLLRQAAGVGKVAWLVEWVDTFLEGSEKFVLYAHHKEVLAGLVRGLKHHNPALLLAGCDDVTREVKKFATDKTCRLTIASITSAGFGVNGLQGAASHIGIAEPMWTHSKHQQAIDRLHRIGQKDCVNAYYFLAPGTIDDDLWQVVSDKARIVAAAADGEELSQTSVLANLMRKYAKR